MSATLVIGPEEFLADRATRAAIAGREWVRVEAGAEGVAGLLREALSPTLFGDAAVVVVWGIEDLDPEGAAVIVEAIAEGADLVLVHGGGAKGASLLKSLRATGVDEVACATHKRGPETADFISREFNAHRRRATPDAISALAEALGSDLRSLCSAIEQMCVDLDADPIGAEDVALFFGGVAEVSSFQISDAVWERRGSEALRSLRWSIESGDRGRAGPALVSSLAGSLRSLARLSGIPRGASDAATASEVGAPPWKVKILRRQLNRWRPVDLARMTVALADADAAVKGGVNEGSSLDPVQKQALVEELVLGMGQEREAP